MALVTETTVVRAPLAEAWDLYFDPSRWASWVDGFAGVEASDGYPEAGGTLRWRSVPAGRGRVTERVLEHEPRRRHRVAFEDPEATGELAVEFAIEPGGGGEATRVTASLDYRLRSRGPFARIADRLFIRGQMRASVARSLERLRHEAEEPL